MVSAGDCMSQISEVRDVFEVPAKIEIIEDSTRYFRLSRWRFKLPHVSVVRVPRQGLVVNIVLESRGLEDALSCVVTVSRREAIRVGLSILRDVSIFIATMILISLLENILPEEHKVLLRLGYVLAAVLIAARTIYKLVRGEEVEVYCSGRAGPRLASIASEALRALEGCRERGECVAVIAGVSYRVELKSWGCVLKPVLPR